MAGGNKLQKRISKILLNPLKSSRRGLVRSRSQSEKHAPQSVTICCTANRSTDDILAQLSQVHKKVHSLVLQEMIQRPDNVQLFSKIQEYLRNGSGNGGGGSNNFKGVQQIHLLEPHIHYTDYRRWCYKRTNFLHRVRKDAKERDIEVTIHGTLILDNRSINGSQQAGQQQLSQNISSWLALLQQLPQDPDITSLWISLREEAVVNTNNNSLHSSSHHHAKAEGGSRRPSQLELLQSPVQKVFQALVELFNSDTRAWRFVNCHVQYHADDGDSRGKVYEEQTQALVDVAELFHIPLQVQWQPLASSSDSTAAAVGWTRATTTAEQRFPGVAAAKAASSGMKPAGEDDHTSTTYGSSGAFGAVGN